MSARMVESDAQDFLARMSRCVVAAHERGDFGTARVLTEGMAEFERLRRAEPVDHAFRPDARTPACCAVAGCGRGADEHLALSLAANVAPTLTDARRAEIVAFLRSGQEAAWSEGPRSKYRDAADALSREGTAAPLRERLRLIATAGRTMAATTSHPGDRAALEGLADLAEKGPTR